MTEDEHTQLLARRLQLITDAMHKIAYEPFGHSEATAQEVLDAITELARNTLGKVQA